MNSVTIVEENFELQSIEMHVYAYTLIRNAARQISYNASAPGAS